MPRLALILILTTVAGAFAGCGSSSGSNSTENPIPTITSLSPSSLPVESPAQTLTITGANYLTSSTVTFNGAPAAATFSSSTQLTIELTAGDLAAVGSYIVVVTNPSPDGGSASLTFPVTNNLNGQQLNN